MANPSTQAHPDRRDHPLLVVSPYEIDGGERIGADPQTLTPADFDAANQPLRLPRDAIRAKCVDCCAGQLTEIRKCVAFACALWPHRMGEFPQALAAGAMAQRRARSKENTAPQGENHV